MNTEITVPLKNIDDEIKGAIHTLKASSIPIKVSNIVLQLSNYIIDAHNGQTSLFTYKGIWINRIVSVLRSTNTEFIRSTPNWDRICIVHDTTIQPAASYSSDIETRGREPSTTTDITSRNEISTLKNAISSTTTSSYSIKRSKLTSNDKENIKKIYQDLDPSKTWRLSTGTVVENKMEELALACNYEHPVHSFMWCWRW
ncbi:unnamed protein product [Rhizopus stolonifer]